MIIGNIVKNGLGYDVIMAKLPEDIIDGGFLDTHKQIKCRICGVVLKSLRPDTYGVEALMELVYHIRAKHSGNVKED